MFHPKFNFFGRLMKINKLPSSYFEKLPDFQ
jgi:hypothetical protein